MRDSDFVPRISTPPHNLIIRYALLNALVLATDTPTDAPAMSAVLSASSALDG
jgi:hypothetical protein